jgi:hypothetical protein
LGPDRSDTETLEAQALVSRTEISNAAFVQCANEAMTPPQEFFGRDCEWYLADLMTLASFIVVGNRIGMASAPTALEGAPFQLVTRTVATVPTVTVVVIRIGSTKTNIISAATGSRRKPAR